MVKHFRDNFNVDFGEIWEYEKRYYLYLTKRKESNSKKINRQKKFLKSLIHQIHLLIVTYGVSTCSQNSEPEKYHELLVRKKKVSCFDDLVEFEWFFYEEKVFPFNQKVSINKDTKNFHYWLAAKIRQYNLDIFALHEFLEFHLHFSFSNNVLEMAEYLEKLSTQYSFIGAKASIEMEVFIEKLDLMLLEQQKKQKYAIKTQEIAEIKKVTKKRPRTRKDYNAYHLTILQSKPDYLQHSYSGLYIMFKELIEYNFIKADIDFDYENFQKLFSGIGVSKSKRFIWCGDNIYLKLFVHYLIKTDKIEPMGNENWTTTIKCFLNKKGKEFTIAQLQHANGGTEKRVSLLYSIVDSL